MDEQRSACVEHYYRFSEVREGEEGGEEFVGDLG